MSSAYFITRPPLTLPEDVIPTPRSKDEEVSAKLDGTRCDGRSLLAVARPFVGRAGNIYQSKCWLVRERKREEERERERGREKMYLTFPLTIAHYLSCLLFGFQARCRIGIVLYDA